jgi:flagellar hook-associated protein 3 FlgL
MTVTSIGSRSMLTVQFLGSMRAQLDDLHRQLGTGKKSDDYAGLGLDRGLTVALRSQLAAISGFNDTIANVGVRLEVAQTALTRITAIAGETKSAAHTSLFDLNGGGQTVEQTVAAQGLDELFALLNSRVGERYIFSGRATDTAATGTPDLILNGDGMRAGFKQVMAERLQADLGANGLGRLATTRVAAAVSIAEDVAGSPFGFKIAGMGTTVTGAVITPPAGAPPSESIDFTGSTPIAGDTVTLLLSLPDGTSETLRFTATTSTTPGAGQFTIGPTDDDTAINFHAALDAALATLGQTALRAASGMAAAQGFFDVDDSRPPQRVAGPPFDTATALIDGTAANTVTWYGGEGGTDPARGTAVARIDPSMTVAYGMRATEQGLRSVVQAVAVFAANTFSATDPNGSHAYLALKQRIATVLGGPPGQQKVMDIAAELGGAQASVQAASERHLQTKNSLTDLLQGIEDAPLEEVGAQILALQTHLEASLQTTAILYRTSLLEYI